MNSEAGRRHIFMWLSKRMSEFASWLGGRGESWPKNLVAMTSVTSAKFVKRVERLTEVPALLRALSVEPLRTAVTLPLTELIW